MSTETKKLSPLQIHLVTMMEWFHRFCVDNYLTYYVLGGTMLGAARHSGFIPWDDDIDVGLPRKDYEKLLELMNTDSYLPYLLETPYSKAPEYSYPYSKIYDTRTTLIENRRKKVIRGVYIDVFPLDGLGNSEEECKKNYEPINKKYNLLLSLVGGIRRGRSLYKNVAVIMARLIPPFIISDKKVMSDLDKLCASHEFEKCTWICNDLGAWRLKEAMPKSILGQPTLYPFEGIKVYGAENADAYLTHLYGDWRQLPPKEKRKTHHDFVELDLEKPYLSQI